MAVLNDNSSEWPTTKDTYIEETDDPKTGKTRVRASIPNGVYKWIENTQNDLGGSLAGSKADAKTRLEVRHADDGTDLDKTRILGANGLTTLQLANADLPLEGGKLFLPPGTETITAANDGGTPISNKSHVEGSGYNSLIISATGKTRGLMIADADAEGISFEKFRIDGNNDGQATNAEHYANIDLSYLGGNTRASSFCRAAHLWSVNPGGDGIHLRNNWYTDIHGVYIDVNWQEIGANLRGRNGISHLYGDTLVISNAIIRRAGNAGIDLEPAITASYVKKVVISNCVILDSLYGIALVGLSLTTGKVEDICINNCIIKVGDKSATGFNTGTAGIIIANVQNVSINNCRIIGQDTLVNSGVGINITNSKNITINNCTVKGCEVGINIDYNGGTSEYIQISGGEYASNYQQGIKIMNASGTPGNYFSIMGVAVFNNGQGGAYSGIQLNYADYCSLSNNLCYDNQGSPTQVFGMAINNSDQVNLVGNIANGNLTGAYQVYLANCANFEYGHNQGMIVFS